MISIKQVIVVKPNGKNGLNRSEERPFVSVIIPFHNGIDYLSRSISSILRQTYTNYEIIIVDDASDKKDKDWIVRTYSSSDIRIVRLMKNVGPAAARNEGIKAARGEVIAFLDFDDEWLPAYLQHQIDTLNSNPCAALAFCDCIAMTEDGARTDFIYREDAAYENILHRLLSAPYNFILSLSMTVARSDALKRVGIFNGRLRISHDKELYVRLLKAGYSFAYTPGNLVVKHQRHESLSLKRVEWVADTTLFMDMFYSESENAKYKHLENGRREFVLGFLRREFKRRRGFLNKFGFIIEALRVYLRYGQSFGSQVQTILMGEMTVKIKERQYLHALLYGVCNGLFGAISLAGIQPSGR